MLRRTKIRLGVGTAAAVLLSAGTGAYFYVKNSEDEKAQLRSSLKITEEEMDSLKQLQKDLEQENEQITAEKENAEKQAEQLTQDKENLESQVEDLNATVDGLNTQVDSLNTTVDGLNTQIDSLNATVDGLNTENDGLSAYSEALLISNGELNKKAAELQTANDELAQAQADLDKKNAELAAANKVLTETNTALEEDKTALATKNGELASENKNLTEANARLTGDNQTLAQDKAALETKNGELVNENTALNQTNTALQSQNAALNQTNTALQSQNAALNQTNTALQAQNDSLTAANTALTNNASQVTQSSQVNVTPEVQVNVAQPAAPEVQVNVVQPAAPEVQPVATPVVEQPTSNSVPTNVSPEIETRWNKEIISVLDTEFITEDEYQLVIDNFCRTFPVKETTRNALNTPEFKEYFRKFHNPQQLWDHLRAMCFVYEATALAEDKNGSIRLPEDGDNLITFRLEDVLAFIERAEQYDEYQTRNLHGADVPTSEEQSTRNLHSFMYTCQAIWAGTEEKLPLYYLITKDKMALEELNKLEDGAIKTYKAYNNKKLTIDLTDEMMAIVADYVLSGRTNYMNEINQVLCAQLIDAWVRTFIHIDGGEPVYLHIKVGNYEAGLNLAYVESYENFMEHPDQTYQVLYDLINALIRDEKAIEETKARCLTEQQRTSQVLKDARELNMIKNPAGYLVPSSQAVKEEAQLLGISTRPLTDLAAIFNNRMDRARAYKGLKYKGARFTKPVNTGNSNPRVTTETETTTTVEKITLEEMTPEEKEEAEQEVKTEEEKNKNEQEQKTKKTQEQLDAELKQYAEQGLTYEQVKEKVGDDLPEDSYKAYQEEAEGKKKQKAEEEAFKKRQAEEEAARKKAEEEAAKKQAEEDAKNRELEEDLMNYDSSKGAKNQTNPTSDQDNQTTVVKPDTPPAGEEGKDYTDDTGNVLNHVKDDNDQYNEEIGEEPVDNISKLLIMKNILREVASLEFGNLEKNGVLETKGSVEKGAELVKRI